ncbi:hypothetical protein ASE74_12355 [Pedobacter sp. Leaf216]|uniref:hypothetical protein n=1 Tax=Pedobacter sp. Leaf216 TaxID=1735684 RepID=UPI0006F3E5D1|nr:hypothetical protein [Pedobacter sp. Leaf216]KQM63952.1 hypothetical protein ASE74_12355 [Pedobacter sp. Leaf216]
MFTQKIIDILYRYPKAKLKMYNHYGGLLNYWKMEYNRYRMMNAVKVIPVIIANPKGFPIYFLTGKKYLYQTLFCMASVAKHHPGAFSFTLVDDGTFNKKLIKTINNRSKNVVIIDSYQIKKNLDSVLPEREFPVLHHKRHVYPHIKKITDIHSISNHDEWKLVIDSDMLFWGKANDILDWFKHPQSPIYMQDCTQSYGYSINLMETLSGSKIPPMVNVGVIGLKSSTINWVRLENWIIELEKAEKTSYYLEQALTSMIIGETKSVVLNKEEYIVNPIPDKVNQKEGILHHYVDLSKIAYFTIAWKKL